MLLPASWTLAFPQTTQRTRRGSARRAMRRVRWAVCLRDVRYWHSVWCYGTCGTKLCHYATGRVVLNCAIVLRDVWY
eukprot:3065350-Rhodomonas_salina.1